MRNKALVTALLAVAFWAIGSTDHLFIRIADAQINTAPPKDVTVNSRHAPGDLDPTFSGDGKLTDGISRGDDSAHGVAIQPDGKIVVAGGSWTVSSYDFAVARYNPDGSLDGTFGTDGRVTTDFDSYGTAYSVAVQPDGKIIAAGQKSGSGTDFALARYNPDGSLDTTFGIAGKVTTDFASHEVAYSVALHTDGKIVAAGQKDQSDFALARYNSDGSLDTSFDSDGKVTTDFNGNDAAYTVVVQTDGKIVAGGESYSQRESIINQAFTIVRYNVDGSLDTSFSGDGRVTTQYGPGTHSNAKSLAIQNDGMIVAVGVCSCSGNTSNIVGYRYNSDGSENGNWGTNPSIPGFFGYAVGHSVAVQPNGKIVTVGTVGGGGTYNFAVFRLNADLSGDPTFGINGVLITPIDSYSDAYSVAIQPDEKIVVAGRGCCSSDLDFTIFRFNASGSFDTGFDGDGKVTTDFGFFQGNAFYDTAIQPDGKIVAVGEARGDFAVVRYNSDGSPDTTFGSGTGKVRTNMSSSGDTARAVAIQPDGKILVGGGSYDMDDNQCCVVLARYNADGSLDTTFSGDGIVGTGFYDGTGILSSGASDIVIQPDGKIVAAGDRWDSQSGFLVIRYNPDGSLDTSFDTDGIVTTPVGSTAGAKSVVLQTDGKIVAAGSSRTGSGDASFTIVRYNIDGSLDSTFDGDGLATTLTSRQDEVYSSVLQPDGKIIVAGSRLIISNDYDPTGFALIRYNPNGSLDATFGDAGLVTTGVGIHSRAQSVTLQSDGKIVAAGYNYSDYSNSEFVLVRLTPNGSPDATFDGDGIATADFDNSNDYAYGMALDNVGRAVVVGESEGRLAIARFTLDDAGTPFTAFDYDGDGRADLSVLRPSDGLWYIRRGTAGYMSMAFGEPGDRMVPADYDGDGKTDIAMFRPSTGQWFIFNSLSQTFVNYSWGAAGDLPVPADHDGDGKSDLVVFRQSDGTWYRRLSNNTFSNVGFGVAGDKPVVGDFDGDGFYDIGLYRPSDHNWYILKTGFGFFVQTWGEGGDIPVPADYDGDGKTDVSVWRPSTGQWFRIQSTAGFGVVNWGQTGDMPIPADYDGDGKSDVAVFRPSTGTWFAIGSTNGIIQHQFGQNGDLPTQSAFIY